MNQVADLFTQNIIFIYFIYGLSFFTMGLAIFLEVGHASELDFANALRPLAVFGLLHGLHEWFEMFLLLQFTSGEGGLTLWIAAIRIFLLAVSFLMLILFGIRLIVKQDKKQIQWGVMGALFLLWGIGLVFVLYPQPANPEFVVAADVYTRYSLAIPGAILASLGLLVQRRRFIKLGMPGFGRDVLLAALAFGLYGCIGQLFVSSSIIYPSIYLNQDVFIRAFGFPVQVFRALMAVCIAVFIVLSLRAFEVENNRRLERLREERREERQRLEEMRTELLHRTVMAQENERKRIARELHDETGQTLTALGLGLRGLSKSIISNPQRAEEQADELVVLATSGLDELQRLVKGLRPPQLDDLGLLAALRWCAGEVSEHYCVPIEVRGDSSDIGLPPEVRVAFFRIAQEAVMNAVRHAKPTRVTIDLQRETKLVSLRVEDNGSGFDFKGTMDEAASKGYWGLLGMMERAALVGAELTMSSKLGEGTILTVKVELS
ncbi:MAG: sensor histidine kinase [Anaerolineales bacterium]